MPLGRGIGVAALVIVGCSSGDGGGAADASVRSDARAADAGVGDDDLLPSGATVAAPMLPAPPVLTPCPAGWRATTPADGAPAVCEPWPETGYAKCPAAQLHLPGTTGCRAVGDACPTGAFRDDLPATGVLYVDPSATLGGDGSRSAPFATIAAATAIATAGTVIALAAGGFDEPVVLGDGVELRGACASRTRLTVSTRAVPATVVVTGTGVTVRDVTISGARSGLLVDTDASATIRGVAVEGATEAGIRAHHGGSAMIRDVVIRDTFVDPGDRVSAFGLVVELGGHATVSELAVERCGPASVIADAPGTSLALADSVIADTVSTVPRSGVGIASQVSASISLERVVVERARFVGIATTMAGSIDGTDIVVEGTADAAGFGIGAQAQQGSSLRLRRARLARSVYLGASALDEGTTMMLEDTILEDGLANSTGMGGSGVGLANGASGALSRVLVRNARTAGVFMADPGTIALTDVAIENVLPEEATGQDGRGVQLQFGASATLARVSIVRSTSTAFGAVQAGTVRGSDLTIRDVTPETGGPFDAIGLGMNVQLGTILELDRVAISGTAGWATLFASAGTTATLRDLRVENTGPTAHPLFDATSMGRAMDVQRGAIVNVTRAVVASSHDIAVLVWGTGTAATLTDIVVRDTQPDVVTQFGGRAISCFAEATTTIRGARLLRNREIALSSYGAGTTLDAEGVTILDTAETECARDECITFASGIGLGSYDGASARLRDFTISRSALCGAQVATGAGLDLTRGDVSFAPIGANIQVPGFDVARLSDGVAFHDNERNLDATLLPVPDASASIPAPDAM